MKSRVFKTALTACAALVCVALPQTLLHADAAEHTYAVSNKDILDVIAANKFLLGVKELEQAQQTALDVNHSGKPDAGDALLILKFALEMITSVAA